MQSMEDNCTLLLQPRKTTGGAQTSIGDLKAKLESTNEDDKVEALKHIITGLLNGEEMRSMLMHVIRFACTSSHHKLKRLLMIYWECVPKRGDDGKLLPEMILVCNALRNDLNHANEYIRGCTLRLCTKLREREVIEPLIPSITANLEHRHAYVRRNAVIAIFAIYKSLPALIPNGPELVDNFLQTEPDLAAKRNAFLMLFQCGQDRAIAYMHRVLDQVPSMGDGFQLVVLELARKLCRSHPQEKSRYIKCIITLMETATDTVLFECANTLVAVSNAPTAIRAAAACYTQLLRNQSDNNVKLVVLERLTELKLKHSPILQEIVMEIMRGLQSSNLDIQKQTLALVMDVVTQRTVDEVVLSLKKEILRSAQSEKPSENRQMIVHAIHSCAVRFPEVAPTVVGVLLDLVGDDSTSNALDVVWFAREMVESIPALRASLIEKLIGSFSDIKSSEVYRAVLWILGQYCDTVDEVMDIFRTVKASLGELPLIKNEDDTDTPPAQQTQKSTSTGPTVLADGTYQTQTAAAAPDPTAQCIRTHVLAGEHFLSTAIGNCFTKLVLRAASLKVTQPELNKMTCEAMLVVVGLLRAGSAQNTPSPTHHPMDAGSIARLTVCLRTLSDPHTWPVASKVLLVDTRDAFTAVLAEQTLRAKKDAPQKDAVDEKIAQADDVIVFRQLKGSKTIMSQLDIEDEEFADVSRAVGSGNQDNDFSARLSRMVQLTGFSDPIYAEAFVAVHHYDIVLDIFVVNKSNDTMQNLMVELSTVGDLKLCERPQCHTLAPGTSKNIKVNIKVSSTETGVVFGSIVYDTTGAGGDRNCVLLNDIHIDIMDYLHPAPCSDIEFRAMWAEFEWENKVFVNTKISDLNELLQHIIASTNMACLTSSSTLEGDCSVLSANLHAKSVFGESALLNLSVERLPFGKISGFVRIRSKTQGIALGLGDKVTLCQQQQHTPQHSQPQHQPRSSSSK